MNNSNKKKYDDELKGTYNGHHLKYRYDSSKVRKDIVHSLLHSLPEEVVNDWP